MYRRFGNRDAEKPIPIWVQKAPDPGSGSATLIWLRFLNHFCGYRTHHADPDPVFHVLKKLNFYLFTKHAVFHSVVGP
jgi:hypothetical protein